MSAERFLEQTERVLIAAALALRGASTPVIEEAAGVTRNIATRCSRNAPDPSASARRRSSPRWFEAKLSRLFHCFVVVQLYRAIERSALSPAERLIQVYDAYLAHGLEDPLDLNAVFEALRFYQSGRGMIRLCSACGAEHFTFSEGEICPACRVDAQTTCHATGCNNLLPERGEDARGRRRTLCDACFNQRWRTRPRGLEDRNNSQAQAAPEPDAVSVLCAPLTR